MTQRRLAAMGELAAGLAHEINNPLGGLSNAVEVLRARELPPAKREQYLALLAGGLERIGETVRRLRRFTPREPRDEEVELAGVARDAVELVRHRAGRLGVVIALSAPREPCVVAGAKNEIGQALLNLLSNALDAIEEHGSRDPLGPRIDVGVATEPEGFLVAVRDNGPGVSAEELTRVSDLFYTTKDVGKGTGLGLALVHNAMAKHGGSVRVDAEHGRGFLVELRFPRGGRRDGPA
jgi:signal transduction histidine kinase